MELFTISKNGILKGYKGKDTVVTIPDGVKKIGSMAFYMNSKIESITIPGSVTEIGESAFYGCSNLTHISILPGKSVSICEEAFGDCSNLTELELPETLGGISETAFRGCIGLADESGNIIIGDTLYAYIGTDTEVFVSEEIKTIAGDAFKWCDSVEKVYIPEGVERIGAYAFCGCSSLKEITVPESVKNIGDFAFAGCPQLADDDGYFIIHKRLFAFNGKQEVLNISAEIEAIEPWAFNGCQSVVEVTIPDSVKDIGQNAFYQCGKLSKITLPNGLKTVPSGIFSGCVSLSSIVIPETVTQIGDRAFYECSSITNIVIPDAVTAIGENAFMSCENLCGISLPKKLAVLGDGAFKSCRTLKDIRIPIDVKAIGPNTFSRCDSLEMIEAPGHLRKDIDDCYLSISVHYYDDKNTSESNFLECSSAYEEESAVNKIVIKCKIEDQNTIRQLLEEALTLYYLTGACLDSDLFEKALAEVRENDALCKTYTTDDSVCAEIADGIEAGEILSWKLLHNNSFSNEFGSIACVGEKILNIFPYVDFSIVYQTHDISESTERVWTENGNIRSEWME